MNSTCQCFLAPKLGEAREDCEDSIHPEQGNCPDGAGAAFAVSDGTTTSFFSGLWARILTRRFAANPAEAFDTAWGDWLKDAQREWQADVTQRAAATDASFYTRNDVLSRKPAAATFVSLLLDPPTPEGTISWRALVLGDSCLFILGLDGPRSMELTKAEEFSNMVKAAESYEKENPHQPRLFASTPRGPEPHLLGGDVILLATDALSKWLLLRAELNQPVWGSVLALDSQSEFETFIAHARREAEAPLENDDVALVVLQTGAPHVRYLSGRFEPKPKPEKPPPPAPPMIVPAAPAVPPSVFVSIPPAPRPRKPDSISASRWAAQNRWRVVSLATLIAFALMLILEARRDRQHESALAVFDGEVARLRENLVKAGAEKAALSMQLTVHKEQVASLSTNRDDIQKQQANLTAKLVESDRQKTGLTSQITTQAGVVASLRKKLDDLMALHKNITAKLAEADQQKTALADQFKQAAEAEKQKLDDAKAKIAELEAGSEAMKKTILEKKFVTEKEIEAIDRRINEKVEESVKFAEESKYPDPSEALTDIYVHADDMEPVGDSSLDEHLTRIETYMRSCGLLAYPRTKDPLRSELAFPSDPPHSVPHTPPRRTPNPRHC